jgi:hypothetical protein
MGPKGMVRAAAALALLGLLTAAPGARAGVRVTYNDGDRALFSVSVPDFWTMRTGGARELVDPKTEEGRAVERVMGMQPVSDDRVWVGFVSPKGVSTFDQARGYLRDIGPFLLDDAQVDKTRQMRISGLPAGTISGRGTRNGRAVGFTAVMIDLPGGRFAISVAVFEAGGDPAFIDEVNDMSATFRAIR